MQLLRKFGKWHARRAQKEPFRKVGDSAMNDYEMGMPAAHTHFQVKSLALIANARKYGIFLHRVGDCHR